MFFFLFFYHSTMPAIETLGATTRTSPLWSSDKVTVLFVLGGPGAGKGIQCVKLFSTSEITSIYSWLRLLTAVHVSWRNLGMNMDTQLSASSSLKARFLHYTLIFRSLLIRGYYVCFCSNNVHVFWMSISLYVFFYIFFCPFSIFFSTSFCMSFSISVTSRDSRVSHLEQVYIRGSHVRYSFSFSFSMFFSFSSSMFFSISFYMSFRSRDSAGE